MSKGATIREVEISAIEVLNPRERNQKVFQELVDSIRVLGLKKPITVAERSDPQGTRYVLVCGQGRMEAFQALGHPDILTSCQLVDGCFILWRRLLPQYRQRMSSICVIWRTQ
jgi:hypothetical protein